MQTKNWMLLSAVVLAACNPTTTAPRITMKDLQAAQGLTADDAAAPNGVLPIEWRAIQAFVREQTPGFQVRDIVNIYRFDHDGPAYHVVRLNPTGYVTIAQGSFDHPIRDYSTESEHPIHQLPTHAARYYYIANELYAAEDDEGRFLGSTEPLSLYRPDDDEHATLSVTWEPGDDGATGTLTMNDVAIPVQADDVIEHFFPTSTLTTDAAPKTWEWIKRNWRPGFAEQAAEDVASRLWESFLDALIFPKTDPTANVPPSDTLPSGMTLLREARISSTAPLYNQLRPHWGLNERDCHTGCGPTAVAMLFGWANRVADQAMGTGSAWDRASIQNLLPADVTEETDTIDNQAVQQLIIDLRNALGTFCYEDSGATLPWELGKAADVLRARRVRLRFSTNYGYSGVASAIFNNWAESNITNDHIPVVIGGPSGRGPHYFIVDGFRERKSDAYFFGIPVPSPSSTDYHVNNGWALADGNIRWQHNDGTYAILTVKP